MRPRPIVPVQSVQLFYWMVMFFLVMSVSGCEFLQNPNAQSAENLAIQDLAMATPEENIVIQDLAFVDGTQWYVSTTGDDANHCHKPDVACRHIQTAIDRAAEGDTIHIADGKYYEQLLLTKPLKISTVHPGKTR